MMWTLGSASLLVALGLAFSGSTGLALVMCAAAAVTVFSPR